MKLSELLSLLARETNLSFVAEESLDQREVVLEAPQDVSIDDLMNMVSRRIGVEVHRAGDIYYVGSFRAEDRALLVRRVRRLESADVQTAVGVLLSSEGRVTVYDDGLTIIGDKLQVLSRIDSLLDQVESADVAVWAAQFWLISMTDQALEEVGMDIVPSLDVAIAFAQGSAAAGSTALLSGGLDAVLNVAEERNGAELMVEHLALLRDGTEHDFFSGDAFPIRVSRVSDEGTATTQGIEFVETGLQINGSLREYAERTARISVAIELSELTALIDGSPQMATTRFEAEAIVESDGVYLLRSHRLKAKTNNRKDRFAWLRRDEGNARTLQLWCKCRRVGGPAILAESDVRSEREEQTATESKDTAKGVAQQGEKLKTEETAEIRDLALPDHQPEVLHGPARPEARNTSQDYRVPSGRAGRVDGRRLPKTTQEPQQDRTGGSGVIPRAGRSERIGVALSPSGRGQQPEATSTDEVATSDGEEASRGGVPGGVVPSSP